MLICRPNCQCLVTIILFSLVSLAHKFMYIIPPVNESVVNHKYGVIG